MTTGMKRTAQWRRFRGLCRRLIAGGIGIVTAAMATCLAVMPAAAQQVWLGVRGPDTHQGEAADWDALFKPTPQWDALANKIQVFTITAGFVNQAPDAALKADMANLTRHHIAIGLGMQSVAIFSSDRCGRGEGYGPPGYSAKAAEKLHRLGIPLTYLSLDEPLWFGHYDTTWGCRFPIPELAQRVAANIHAYLTYYPNVVVGDIEPVPAVTSSPDWQAAFDSLSNDITQLTGRRLAYLQTDVNWRMPSVATLLQRVARFAHQRQLKFGIFYKGDSGDASGAAWAADAVHRFELIEADNKLVPEQAIFATWERYPRDVLPVTNSDTLGYVVARYRLPSAKLIAAWQGTTSVSGRLTDSKGDPIARAPVALKIYGLAPGHEPPVQSTSGTVPTDARFAIVGLRVNIECLCSGDNDLLVGDVSYAESAGGSARDVYRLPAEVARFRGRAKAGATIAVQTINGGAYAHLKVRPNQQFEVSSQPFKVTPGAHFELSVPLASPTDTGMFGYATVIWLDAAQRGLRRTFVYLGHQPTLSRTALTDDDGRFQFRDLSPVDRPPATVAYSGGAVVRGTFLRLP